MSTPRRHWLRGLRLSKPTRALLARLDVPTPDALVGLMRAAPDEFRMAADEQIRAELESAVWHALRTGEFAESWKYGPPDTRGLRKLYEALREMTGTVPAGPAPWVPNVTLGARMAGPSDPPPAVTWAAVTRVRRRVRDLARQQPDRRTEWDRYLRAATAPPTPVALPRPSPVALLVPYLPDAVARLAPELPDPVSVTFDQDPGRVLAGPPDLRFGLSFAERVWGLAWTVHRALADRSAGVDGSAGPSDEMDRWLADAQQTGLPDPLPASAPAFDPNDPPSLIAFTAAELTVAVAAWAFTARAHGDPRRAAHDLLDRQTEFDPSPAAFDLRSTGGVLYLAHRHLIDPRGWADTNPEAVSGFLTALVPAEYPPRLARVAAEILYRRRLTPVRPGRGSESVLATRTNAGGA